MNEKALDRIADAMEKRNEILQQQTDITVDMIALLKPLIDKIEEFE